MNAIDFEAQEQYIRRTQNAFGMAIIAVQKEAEAPLAQLLRSMLLENYDERMNVRTGYMRDVISQSGVTMRLGWENPRITYWLPGRANNYDNSPTGFYQIFSALAYGAVRGTGASKRFRKNMKTAALKNAALAGKVGKKKKSRTLMFRGYETTIANITDKSARLTATRAVSETETQSESVIVIKPKHFWPLDESQERELKSAAVEIISDLIRRRA
jgi:hypothetical protein